MYLKSDHKNRRWMHLVLLPLVLFLISISAGGCDYGLQAVIMSPGPSEITIQKCETVAFEGFGIGGFPFESDESEDGELYGYYWDAEDNEIDSRTEKKIEITFKIVGVFTVSFTVTDKRGAQETVETTVIVLPNEDNADCDDEDDTDDVDDDTDDDTTTTTTTPTTTTTMESSEPTTTTMTSSTTTTTLSEIDDDEDTTLQATVTEPPCDEITIMPYESITFIGEADGGDPISDNDPYEYYWYRDDDLIDTSKSATVYFDTEGEYTITFEARDYQSVTAKYTVEVIVKAVDTNGNCQGCCRCNGGVDCDGSVTQCADGTDLSDTCVDNDCDACP